jgi:poly(3-hydroxybutyrate) depolymerase
MFRQLTHAMFGATTLSARVMAKAIAVPADTVLWAHETTNRKPPQWHSRNKVVRASPFALLRDFSVGDDDVVPTLLFPPLAGHASCIIDKRGESQVQLCLKASLTKLYSFDWLSCTKATKDITEADRLDFITRAVDLIAGPEGAVNIVGDCQGGWEAALWAAMHPGRVNTLTVAGAPIDTGAGNGPAQKLMPIVVPGGNVALFKAMVKACGGIVPGINNVMWSIATHPATHVAEHLKVYGHVHDREHLDHFNDFYDWYLYPVNLPGRLYLWAVEHLFVKNEMFNGELEVAGQPVNLRSITCPVFLLGGEQDDITPWQQVHNMRYAVGSSLVRWYLAPGGHIGLFIGRHSQAEYWTPILAQVRELSQPEDIANPTTSTPTRTTGDTSGQWHGESKLCTGDERRHDPVDYPRRDRVAVAADDERGLANRPRPRPARRADERNHVRQGRRDVLRPSPPYRSRAASVPKSPLFRTDRGACARYPFLLTVAAQLRTEEPGQDRQLRFGRVRQQAPAPPHDMNLDFQYAWAWPAPSEPGPEVLDLLGALAQFGVGGPLADAGQGPADGLRSVGREPGGDQRVQGLQISRAEPGHHRGEVTILRLVRRGHPQHHQAPAALALAGDELEPVGLRPPLRDIPLELLDRVPVGLVESVQGILVAFRWGRGFDGHLDHDLARLDRRVVAVLQHRDAVHRSFREVPPDFLLDEIGGRTIQAFHRRPSEDSPEIRVTRESLESSTDYPLLDMYESMFDH